MVARRSRMRSTEMSPSVGKLNAVSKLSKRIRRGSFDASNADTRSLKGSPVSSVTRKDLERIPRKVAGDLAPIHGTQKRCHASYRLPTASFSMTETATDVF